MTLTITTAAPTHDLTNLDTITEQLGVTDKDSIISGLISAASSVVCSYCNRFFARETLTEALSGSGGVRLMLERTPVVSVAEIRFNSGVIDASEYKIEDEKAGILFRRNGFRDVPFLARGIVQDPLPFRGEELWEVDYTAGYITPPMQDDSNERDLPHDVEQACIAITRSLFFSRDTDPNLKQSKVSAFWSGSYTQKTISDSVKEMLSPYRRHF